MNLHYHKIGDICSLVRGTSPTMKTLPGPYPLVVTAAFRRSSTSYQLDGPAVCVPLISSTGDAALHRVHYQEGKFALADLLVALLPRNPDICDARYLYHLLMARKNEYFIPLMFGTANVSLKENDIANVEIPLPTLTEQQRMVARIEELEAQVDKARSLRQQAKDEAEILVTSKMQDSIKASGSNVRYLPFTEVTRLERRPVNVQLDQNYQEIGVYSYGRGIFHKIPRTGAEVGEKDLYQIRAGDFILQITFAWEGAVALAEQEDDGLYGSVRYLTFRVNEEICSPWYLLVYMKTPEAISQLGGISPGSAGRNRVLSVKRLGEVMVPIIPLEYQRWMTDALKVELQTLRNLQAENAAELDALMPSILDRAFKGEL